MTMRLVALLAVTLGLGGVGVEGSQRRLRVDVSPRFTAAPGAVRVRAIVEPEAANRSLEIVADSERYYRSSTIELDGANAAAVTELRFLNLPKGAYEITVILTAADGSTTSERRTVGVGGPF